VTQQINLFNPAFLKQRKVFSAAMVAPALLALLVAAVTIGVVGQNKTATLKKFSDGAAAQLVHKQALQSNVMQQFPARHKSSELASRILVEETQLKALQGVNTILLRGDIGNTHGYADYFKALARQRVSGLWLTGVSITGAGNAIEIQGRSTESTLVPSFFSRLSAEAVMHGKTFDALQLNQPTQKVKSGKGADEIEVEEPTPYIEFSWTSVPDDAAGGHK
jgi:hypothetical protein